MSETTPEPIKSNRSLGRWLAHRLWMPTFTALLGVAYAGAVIYWGTPALGTVEMLVFWGLFGFCYGLLVVLLRLLADIGYGNGFTVWLAPILGLTFAWNFGGLFVANISIVQLFLVAVISSLVFTPVTILLWKWRRRSSS